MELNIPVAGFVPAVVDALGFSWDEEKGWVVDADPKKFGFGCCCCCCCVVDPNRFVGAVVFVRAVLAEGCPKRFVVVPVFEPVPAAVDG